MPKCELCGDLLAATVKPLKTVPLSGKLTNTVSRGYGIRGPVLGVWQCAEKTGGNGGMVFSIRGTRYSGGRYSKFYPYWTKLAELCAKIHMPIFGITHQF